VSTRLRSESGQATLELAGTTLWLLLAALFAWQMGMIGWTWASTANAARTAARLYSRTGDSTAAADDGKKSLNAVLRGGAQVWFDGDTAEARVDIPLVLPGLPSGLHISEHAEMPQTG
jgi:TadE-like protein